MIFDSNVLRRQFPIFAALEAPLYYLDNAATSQIHQAALEAMLRQESRARGSVQRGNHRLAEAATAAYEQARGQAARFLNAGDAAEVIFTGGATAGLNLVAQAFGETLAAGDEVVISQAEHHSNLVPWQRLRERSGIVLRALPLTDEGRIDIGRLGEVIGRRCRMVAVTHASNVTGAVTDVAAVVAAARAVGARVLLDGAQAVQHGPVDVRALGVDFYAFSGHKVFGPTGVGVLWGRGELLAALPPWQSGGGMVGRVTLEETSFAAPPRRFEAGTPPVAPAVGLGAALARMTTLPWEEIHRREDALTARLIEGLRRFPGLRLIGPANLEARLPIVSFDIDGIHPHDLCQVLDARGVALRGGHLCAQPLLARLGAESASRASIALYNEDADVDALLDGVGEAIRILA